MKKINKIIFLLLLTLVVGGCTKKTESGIEVKSSTDLSGKHGVLHCSRGATVTNGVADLSYDITYSDGYITKMHSKEIVSSTDKQVLDTYENAYKNSFKPYENLQYYDNNITRSSDKVISDTVIQYDKVDMDALSAIENSEYSVIKNGKISVNDWLEFAEKFGTKCSEQ